MYSIDEKVKGANLIGCLKLICAYLQMTFTCSDLFYIIDLVMFRRDCTYLTIVSALHCPKQCDQNIFKSLGNFWMVYLVFGKLLYLL